jgi:hypothetical protein
MAFRSVATGFLTGVSSETNTLLCSKPAGTIDGDILVAIVGAGDVLTPPAGWTTVSAEGFYYKKASSEPANYTWTCASNQLICIAIAAYSGRAASGFLDQTSSVVGGGPGTTIVATALTTTSNNEDIIWAWISNGNTNSQESQSFPALITNRAQVIADSDHIVFQDYQQCAIGDGFLAAPGTLGTGYTNGFQTPSSAYNVFMLSLEPPATVSFAPPLGVLTLTALVPTFKQTQGMVAPLGVLTLTAFPPSLQNVIFSPPLGVLTLTAFPPVALGTVPATVKPVRLFLARPPGPYGNT